MPKLREKRIAGILQTEISRAAGSDMEGGELVSNRENAIDYVLGRKGGGSPPEGTSKYVSHDVGDGIDALLGELLPSFSGDVVARFEENGPNDQTASIESDVVSEFIMDRNPGTVILHDAIFSILAQKNGIIRVYVDNEETSRTVTFANNEAAAIAAAQAELSGLTAELRGKSVTITQVKQTLQVRNIEPENFLYASNHRSIFLDGIRFCGEITYPTRSDLAAMGVPRKKIDKLNATHPEFKSDVTTKRVGGGSSWNDSETHDQDEIRCIRCFRMMPVGLQEDAIESELWEFLYAHDTNTVLLKQPADMIDYCAGYAWGMPGRFEGISVYDKLAPIADAKSDAIRQILENMRAANNGKTAHNERVDPDDVLNQRAAATIAVEGEGPVSDSIMQLTATDILSQGLAFLEYLDGVRTERIGASLDLSSPEFQVMSDTAHGTERVMSAREQRSGKNALMIAETLIRSLYLLVHKTLRMKWQGPIPVNLRGEWQEIDPSVFPERDRVTITHGISPGERVRKGQALGAVLQTQTAIFEAGLDGILTDADRIHNTLTDQSRAMGLEAPERYFIDPQSQPARDAAEQKAQAAAEAQAKQDELTQVTLQLERLDRQLKKQEIVFDYFKARLDSETDLAKAGLQSQTDIETTAISSAGQLNGSGEDSPAN